jgi:DNA-binding transcriptional LysR family regulator
MLDLRHLQTLLEVAQTNSYTAAAEKLSYSQSAVSYQMRRLQDEVGMALVVQTGRSLQLSQAGRALVAHAETVFATLRAAQEELAALAAHSGAIVRITCFQSSCATLIPQAAVYLQRTEPDLHISVHQAEPAEARSAIRSGEADLGVLANWDNEPLPDGEDSMRRIPLMTDRRCVVMRRDHPMAEMAEIDFGDLADQRWVMESFRHRFVAACVNVGFAPQIVGTADDHVTIQALVAAGLGITLTSELGLRAYTDPRLVARPLRGWPLRCTYVLLWPDMVSVPAVATVLSALQNAARHLQESGLSPSAAPSPGRLTKAG